MTDTEKWKARAREIVTATTNEPWAAVSHLVADLEQRFAAALAEAAAEGEKYGWQRGHSAATAAQAREQKP